MTGAGMSLCSSGVSANHLLPMKFLRAHRALFMMASAIVLVGFTLALALAASPELHEFFHHDTAAPAHQCLASIFHDASVDSAPPVQISIAPLLPAAPRLYEQQVNERIAFFRSCHRLEHAPPFVS